MRPAVAIPAMRAELPRAARVRIGEIVDGRPRSRPWFDIAVEVASDGGQPRYATNWKLMSLLAKQLGFKPSFRDGMLYVDPRGEKPFQPTRVPIELISDELADFFSARLELWRQAGPVCICRSIAPKPRSLIEEPEQQRALALQGLPCEPSEEDIQMNSAYWVGSCTRYTYAEQDGRVALEKRTEQVCDPLLCPHFRPQDRSVPACGPKVAFHFRLPWAERWSWGWFMSTSWHTARRLATTLSDLKNNLGGVLRGVPCLLVVEEITVRAPKGARVRARVVHVSTDRPMAELRSVVTSLAAIERQGLSVPPGDYPSMDRARYLALLSEFSEGARAE